MQLLHAAILLLACSACQSNPAPRTTLAADAMLLEASPVEQHLIAEAREANDRANDAYAAAKANTTRVRDAQISADLNLEEATAKVARATTNVENKVASGTSESVDAAKRELDQAKTDHTMQAAAAALGARQTDHARALAEVAKEHITVTEAQVELAKARAVNTLDRPADQKPAIKRFEESVRRAETDENVARTRSEATKKEVDLLLEAKAGAAGSSR